MLDATTLTSKEFLTQNISYMFAQVRHNNAICYGVVGRIYDLNVKYFNKSISLVIIHGRGDFIISYCNKHNNQKNNLSITDVDVLFGCSKQVPLLHHRGEKLMDDYLFDWKYDGFVELHLTYARDIKRMEEKITKLGEKE